MVVMLLGACLLLDRNHRQLSLVQVQLETRNQQGALALLELRNAQGQEQIDLLNAAVRRLEC
jgi:hypothetical protein